MRRALLAGVVVAVFGCGEHTQPTMEPTKPYVPGDIEVALANPLHRKHLKEVEPPASCTDCHRIGDKDTNPPIADRCVRCHEEHRPALHAAIEVKEGRECLVCHTFDPDAKVRPGCADCHTGPGLAEWSAAPKIVIHGKEDCEQCHKVHGPQPPPVRPCLECHEQMGVLHNDGTPTDHQACLSCHGPHEKAARARGRCTDCHDDRQARETTLDAGTDAGAVSRILRTPAAKTVPKTAIFHGHDACLKCHTPHPTLSKSGARVKSCESCHTDTHAFGADKVPEHDKCRSCHVPHNVRTSPLTACARCHDGVEPEHPVPDYGGTCVGCHPGHPDATHQQRTQACSSCHDKAKSDTAWHAGNTACTTCHAPHAFDLKGSGPALCKGCHVAQPGGPEPASKKRVAPNGGHGNCVACHEQGPHAPSAATGSCASTGCHEIQAETAPKGHSECKDCHLPHEGKVKATCVSCHPDRGKGSHAEPSKDCRQCHRPHGPEGPEAVKDCRTCHTEIGPAMHQHPKHQRCQDCHGYHGQARQSGSRRGCTSTCHLDMSKHEPEAVNCIGCHPFVQ
ncbi:MAG: hypothetical protein KC933_02255 [Myxococcales bacterium]|nr:hypothetical protein [Myxococcales bacterium]